ncbi:DAD family-domain-containing protein [Lipomyces arxii]|uniref:DAD family-domain-containing protein n=1 Tax=Lipomyces arxii TaxID=56418 RepID=UPI0034CD303A
MAPTPKKLRQQLAANAALKSSPQSTGTVGSSESGSSTSISDATAASKISAVHDTRAIVEQAIKTYVLDTPRNLKFVDAFMVFLVAVGVVQFVYCVLVGNYPFNAFLAGFSITVGQFVLAAALRMQANPLNGKQFSKVSPERAFADFIFGSLVLHFFAYNFIN